MADGVVAVGSPARALEPRASRIPGGAGIWIFLAVDFTYFTAIFAAFMVDRADRPEAFAAARGTVDVLTGGLNTLLLLSASYVAARALRAMRHDERRAAGRYLLAAAALGVAFVLSKAREWAIELDHGHSPGDGGFYVYYYFAGGMHLLHVLIGLAVLAWLHRRMRTGAAVRAEAAEAGVVYWHMVDLLWILLFATIYLAA